MPGARLRKYGATDAHQPDTTAANVGYKARLWQMADALRGSKDAAEYKHVVLGLIFLKYEFRSPWRADFGPCGRSSRQTSRILKNITGAPTYLREQVFSSIAYKC
jgi:hypothetical protein